MVRFAPRADAVNSLLRGEMSAVEAYDLAVEKLDAGPTRDELGRMRAEHLEAAEELRQHLVDRGRAPAPDSGPWGRFATAMESLAQVFGLKAALRVIRQGEKQGIRDYAKALRDEDVDADLKEVIRGRLLPRTQAHISQLEEMIRRA